MVETSSHWYITYLFFHPRDWTDHPFFETEHENDGEGVLLAIERDGSTYGVLRGAVTVAHSDFYSYTPAGSTWSSGRESVDGTMQLQSSPHDAFSHPVTAQEAKGHGLKAYPQFDINGDGLVYYPSTVAETPSSGNDRDVRYAAGRHLRRWRAVGAARQREPVRAASARSPVTLRAAAAPAPGAVRPTPPTHRGAGTTATTCPAGASSPATRRNSSAEYFTIPGGVSRAYTYNPYADAAAALKEAARTAPPTVD